MYRSWIDAAPNADRLAELPDQPARVLLFVRVAEDRGANQAIHRRRGQRASRADRDASVAHDDVIAEQRVQGFDLIHSCSIVAVRLSVAMH